MEIWAVRSEVRRWKDTHTNVSINIKSRQRDDFVQRETSREDRGPGQILAERVLRQEGKEEDPREEPEKESQKRQLKAGLVSWKPPEFQDGCSQERRVLKRA